MRRHKANILLSWIPAPSNGGDISLICQYYRHIGISEKYFADKYIVAVRIYGPAGRVTDGSWKAPIVTKQNAITE